MKKILLMLAVVLTAASCTGQNSKKQETTNETETGKKTLVTFFSATGTTRKAAQQLAEIIGADTYEIQPETPYSDADLDWTNDKSRSSVEMKDLSSRPAIKGTVENIDQYETVYIGFPIWWYTAPTIINTFIEANNLKGKTRVPFATSGGSTIEKSCEDLKKTYPDLNWKEGKLLNSINADEIKEWAAK